MILPIIFEDLIWYFKGTSTKNKKLSVVPMNSDDLQMYSLFLG